MDLHPGEEIVFDGHPSWRATLAFYVWGLLAVAAAVVAGLVASGAGLAVLLGLAALVLLIGAGYVKRAATRYTVTSERLRIQRGILSRRVQQTNIQRVQNVNTDQSFFERILQVGTVDFDTAGTDDSEFRFVGIDDPAEVVAAVERAQRAGAAQSAQ